MTEQQIAGIRESGRLSHVAYHMPVTEHPDVPIEATIGYGDVLTNDVTVTLPFSDLKRIEPGDHVTVTVEITREDGE